MNKHTATDPNGKVHTRNSKTRTYSHCVVARRDRAAVERTNLEAAKRSAKTNYAWYCGRGRTSPYEQYNGDPQTTKVLGKDYATGNAFQFDYPTLTSFQDACVAREQDRLDTIDDSAYDTYFSVGWNSRLDLAQKLASKESGRSTFRDVTILEAVIN